MRHLLKRRDSSRLDTAIKTAGDRKIAGESIRMVFPSRWLERELAVIENVITVLGFVALITDDGSYAVTMVPAFFRTKPDRITKDKVDDESYTVFWYDKGSEVIASTDVVMIDNLVHTIYTDLLGQGRIPFYYDYDDVPRFFNDIPHYNGVDGNGDPVIWSFMAATTARDPKDLQKSYRQRKVTTDPTPPVYVGLKRVSFHASSLLSKQGGSYYDTGTTSALANPSSRIDRLESMLTQS